MTGQPAGYRRPGRAGEEPHDLLARPLRRDARRNLERILDAATEIFAEHGYGATMEQVAERASLGVGTVYRRFPSKSALVRAVVEAANERTRQIALDVLGECGAAEGVYEFLRRWVAAPSCWRVISSRAPEIADAPAIGVSRIAPIVERLIANARAAGTIRGDVVFTDLAVAVMSLRAVADLFDPQVPGSSARHLELVMAGLRPGGTWTNPPMTTADLGSALAGR